MTDPGLRASPLVSIGLPVYNGLPYLSLALDSLLAQTFRDFELIVSDNASVDATADVARYYAGLDGRIRYQRQARNVGLARNFEAVVRASRGKYFKMATADDLCSPTLVERCVDVLETRQEVVLCYARTTLIDDRGQPVERYDDRLAISSPDPVERFKAVLDRVGLVNVLQGLVRRDVLCATPLLRRFFSGDVVLLAELALHGQFAEVPEFLFFRRMHEGVSTRLPTPAARQAFIDPSARWNGAFEQTRRYPAYLALPFRAPLALNERARLLARVLRMTMWARGLVLREALEWIGRR